MWYFLPMPRQAAPIQLCQSDQTELERWVAAHRTPQQVVLRCRIVLAAAQGRQDKIIAGDLGVNYKTVALWRQRFGRAGVDCLWEVAEGRGRKPVYDTQKIREI